MGLKMSEKEKSIRQTKTGIQGVQNPNPHSNYTSPIRVRRSTLPSFGFNLFDGAFFMFYEFTELIEFYGSKAGKLISS
jgi:hypothetical protein